MRKIFRLYYVSPSELKEASQIEHLAATYHLSRNDLLKRLIRLGLQAAAKDAAVLLSGNLKNK